MPFALEQLTQGLSVLGVLHSQSLAAGTDNSITNIDFSRFQRILWILDVGVLGASATVDLKLQHSATSGGTYTDITGTAITQITTNNHVVTIELRADQMPSNDRYIRHNLVVGVAASQLAVIVLGGEAEWKPGKSQDIAAVAQRLVL
jgi:hypothetical protein